MDKKKQELQRKQEDQALVRALMWVGAAVVLEMLVFFINRNYINYKITEDAVKLAVTLHSILRGARVAAPVVAVVGAVLAYLQGKKGQSPMLGVIVSIAAAAVGVCAHVSVAFKDNGVRMLFLLVPVWAAMALVYYLYQHEFFLSLVMCVLAAMAIWFVRMTGLSMEMLLCDAALVAVLAVTLMLKKSDGVLAGKQLLPENSNYLLVLGTGAGMLALQVLALALGSMISYYLIFVVAGWAFALLVYYTVKMM